VDDSGEEDQSFFQMILTETEVQVEVEVGIIVDCKERWKIKRADGSVVLSWPEDSKDIFSKATSIKAKGALIVYDPPHTLHNVIFSARTTLNHDFMETPTAKYHNWKIKDIDGLFESVSIPWAQPAKHLITTMVKDIEWEKKQAEIAKSNPVETSSNNITKTEANSPTTQNTDQNQTMNEEAKEKTSDSSKES